MKSEYSVNMITKKTYWIMIKTENNVLVIKAKKKEVIRKVFQYMVKT